MKLTKSGWFSGMALWAGVAMAQVAVPVVQVRQISGGSAEELSGVIQPVKQSMVSAQASGRVATLAVKAGDKVRAGQTLATIDAREVQVDMQRSQAQVNQAEADLHNIQAQTERTRELQRQGYVSKAALDIAEAQLKSAEAGRDQAAAAQKQSGIANSYTRVTAPYDGWIQSTQVEVGDLAVPGKPILTMYAPLPLRAVVQVPASRTQIVREAGKTEIQISDANGNPAWVSPIARLAVPSADPVAQTVEWRLDIAPKDSARLVAGQQTTVRFSSSGKETQGVMRLALPKTAIASRGEMTGVYVVSGKTFVLRAVRLGESIGDSVQVLAGLNAGEVVAQDAIRAAIANAVPAAEASK